MAKQLQNLGEVYAERAMAESDPLSSGVSIPRIREARDIVYSGTMPPQDASQNESFAASAPGKNRKSSKRKISPFNVIMILFGIAVVSVLYISNILAVGRLVVQIDQMQKQHQQLTNEQELLKAQINRLSALDRVQQLAQDRLGMRAAKDIPQSIAIDPARVEQIEGVVQSQTQKAP